MNRVLLIGLIGLLAACVDFAAGHGRLMEPPSRSSLWRFEEFAQYEPPINYIDNQLFCGGVQLQYEHNGGKCGECGDPYNATRPRENENNGLYGRGVIARTYRRGQLVEALVDITAEHKGYFRFSICPLDGPNGVETEECFNENILLLADGSGTDYPVNLGEVRYTIPLVLPQRLTCDRCVFRWHYHTGNSWGECSDGTQGQGCGNQEEFRGCADISILDFDA